MPSALISCPFPFPDAEATTHIEVYQEIDTPYNGPQATLIYDGLAIYDQTTKNVFSAESKQIALSGTLIVKGDVQVIGDTLSPQGYVQIGNDRKRIYGVSKPQVMGFVVSTEIVLQ